MQSSVSLFLFKFKTCFFDLESDGCRELLPASETHVTKHCHLTMKKDTSL